MHEFKHTKGIKSRLIIHEILYAIKYKNKSFENLFEEKKNKNHINTADSKLINDVVLSSMRLFLFVNKIINIYVKKKPKKHQYILLLSSITQLVFLNYKNYAVINCSVEIAKNKKINGVPNFINGVLKKIDSNKSKLKKISLDKKIFSHLSNFNLIKKINLNTKIEIFNSISEKPDIHLVFKKNINNKISKKLKKTSEISGIIERNNKLSLLAELKRGDCWVQDFSAMLPLHLIKNLKNLKALDMCSAPGGKTFQLIQKGANVNSIEVNKLRLNLLKLNLNRLNYFAKIISTDVLKIKNENKYNIVVLDAPCTSVGTARRNPDIFFKEKKIDLQSKLILQKKLLEKADKLLLNNGVLIYMVCSFLYEETNMQINNFLKHNKNYEIEKFDGLGKYSSLIDINGFIKILPQKFKNINIDGFFAAKLTKND